MASNLRKYFGIHFGTHLFGCVWIFLMSTPNTAMYVDDSCTMDSQTGVCKLASKCPELEAAVKGGLFLTRDVVHCGFAIHEEIICCPIRDGVETKTKPDDSITYENLLLSTTPLTITTSNTSPEASKSDFFIDLPSRIPTSPIEEVSTTTVKPLIINGKQVDPNERFIELTAMFYNNRQEVNDKSESMENQFESAETIRNHSPSMPASMNDRTFNWQNPNAGIPISDWNMSHLRQFSDIEMPPFQPNPEKQFHNSRHTRQQTRRV